MRISLPHLLHGSSGPATAVRRTMFPWFVKVQDDHGELESIEGGSWAQVARANRDLTAPPGTAIGNHHHHKYPNARFPASVPLYGIAALPDALLGQRRWDDPLVIHDRNILLGSDKAAFDKYIAAYQTAAAQKFREAFMVMRAEEKRVYLHKSYFARVDSEPYVESDLTSDPDDIDPDQEAVAGHSTVLYWPGVGSSYGSSLGTSPKLMAAGTRGVKRKASRSPPHSRDVESSDVENSDGESSDIGADDAESMNVEGSAVEPQIDFIP